MTPNTRFTWRPDDRRIATTSRAWVYWIEARPGLSWQWFADAGAVSDNLEAPSDT